MKAVAFKSKIKNNKIEIPVLMQSRLKAQKEKNVRVIVLIDDTNAHDNLIFQQTTKAQFLKGYAEADSVYDND